MILKVYSFRMFGDCFKTIQAACKISECTNAVVHVSDHKDNHINMRLHEIISVLGMSDHIKVTNLDPDTYLCENDICGFKYYESSKLWSNIKNKNICYQLDGISDSNNKNPPKEDIQRILNFPGYNLIKLGKHLSLDECVNYIVNSTLFVGVCSGMSHLCHSVRIPTFIVKYNNIVDVMKFHSGGDYILCDGTDDLILKAHETINFSGSDNIITPFGSGWSRSDKLYRFITSTVSKFNKLIIHNYRHHNCLSFKMKINKHIDGKSVRVGGGVMTAPNGDACSMIFCDNKVSFLHDNKCWGISYNYKLKIGVVYNVKILHNSRALLGKIWTNNDEEPSEWQFGQPGWCWPYSNFSIYCMSLVDNKYDGFIDAEFWDILTCWG